MKKRRAIHEEKSREDYCRSIAFGLRHRLWKKRRAAQATLPSRRSSRITRLVGRYAGTPYERNLYGKVFF